MCKKIAMVFNAAFILICIINVTLVGSQWYDFTGKPHKWTMRHLGQELLADAILKVKQTVDIRREHSRFISYEVGFIIGVIREKFKLMMELYRVVTNRILKRATLGTPLVSVYQPIDYFRKYENIHTLELEIDKLVEVLETSFLNIEQFPSMYEFALRSGAGHSGAGGTALRTGEDHSSGEETALRIGEDHSDSEEQKQKALEEAVKSRYREEYLMRKLNQSGQSTTKKRFLDNWPVPGTWSLETY